MSRLKPRPTKIIYQGVSTFHPVLGAGYRPANLPSGGQRKTNIRKTPARLQCMLPPENSDSSSRFSQVRIAGSLDTFASTSAYSPAGQRSLRADSIRYASTSERNASRRYRTRMSRIITPSVAAQDSISTFHIDGSSDPPSPMTGCGCCVRNHQIEKYTSGMSSAAKIPKTDDTSARRSGSSTSVRRIK